MSVKTEIKKICRQIVDNFNPQKVILFGSYAYGNPNSDSDVDLLVIMPFNERHSRKAIEIRLKIKTVVPLDLLVRTPEHIQERIEMGDFFMQEINQRGKILYDSTNAGMD
jgi:predicted nucleotidyltransferase